MLKKWLGFYFTGYFVEASFKKGIPFYKKMWYFISRFPRYILFLLWLITLFPIGCICYGFIFLLKGIMRICFFSSDIDSLF